MKSCHRPVIRPPRRVAAGLLALALVGACGSSPRTARPSTGGGESKDGELDLQALARQIDPGAVPPLSQGAPAFMKEMFAQADGSQLGPADLAQRAEQITDGITRLQNLADLDLAHLLTLVYLVDQMERRLDTCDLACLAAAETIYASLDIPWLADPETFLGQILTAVAAFQDQVSKEQVDAMFAFLRGVFASAPGRHRLVAARILREAPDSPAATQALRHLARSAEHTRDRGAARDRARSLALARRLRREVVRRSEPAGFTDLADLTWSCLLSEDVACAEESLRRAAAASGREPTRIESLQKDLALTRKILSLAGKRSWSDRLARADLLVDVGRPAEAGPLFEALMAERPRDARPVVGQARALFARAWPTRSAELIQRARGLEGRDVQFYELAVGLTFSRIMALLPSARGGEDRFIQSIMGLLPELREDIDGLARFAPGRGAVLGVVVARLQEGAALISIEDKAEQRRRLRALSRAALADGLALVARVPTEPDAYRLVFLAARFAGRPLDARAIGLEIPAGLAGRDELLLMQAGLLFSQAVAGRDAALLPSIRRALDARSGGGESDDGARQLRADLIALEARLGGDRTRWVEAAKAYRALAGEATTEERGRLHVNLGVALWESGDRAGAAAAWAEPIERGETNHPARFNQIVTAAAPDPAALEPIIADSDRAALRVQAVAWQMHLGRPTGKKRRAALARVEELLAGQVVDDRDDGSTGVIMEESFSIGVGYSTSERLIVQLGLGRKTSLVIPSPTPLTRASRTRR